MNLKSLSVSPAEGAVPPRLKIVAEIEGDPTANVPVSFYGFVDTELGARLGQLTEGAHGGGLPEWHLFLREEGGHYDPQTAVVQLDLELPFDRLRLLETARQKNARRDVLLRVTFGLRFARLHALFSLRSKLEGQYPILALKAAGTAASLVTMPFTRTLNISASDWTQDYLPKLGMARVITVEMPSPEDIQEIKDEKIRERLGAAAAALQKARARLDACQWDEVCSELRPVWEVLRKFDRTKELLEADGYSAEAATAAVAGWSTFFDLGSKFGLHALDKTGTAVQRPSKASREDAEMFFAFATTVLQALTTKAARHGLQS